MFSASASVLGILLSTMAFPAPPVAPHATVVTVEQWQPQQGDTFVVDTSDNTGYLIHPDGQYTSFPVLTGQRRVVHYIGRTYFAATPDRTWEVASSHIKGDRITFGPTGRFLRLYYEGESTSYGIHEHAAEDVMFAREDRYQSMGCIIVRRFVMDIIEQTYLQNGETLRVHTVDGFRPEPEKIAALSAGEGA